MKYLGTLPVSPSALAKLFAMLPVVVVVVVVVAKLASILP